MTPGFADAPVDAAHAFRAAMRAMARPGRIEQLTDAPMPTGLSPAAATLILTLCDSTTPIYLTRATRQAQDWIVFHTGAPVTADPAAAAFAVGTWCDLAPVDRFSAGIPDYPDRSATLIVEVETLAGDIALRGPGIETIATLHLPDPKALAANAALYPLGRDFYFTCGAELAALPRSTRIG